MPLALGAIAVLLFITAIKGNYQVVGQQFQTTFFGGNGQTGFIVWFGSIVGLAFLFRLINAPKAGELFISLLLIVYALQNQGVLGSIESAIQSAGAGNGVASSGAGTGSTSSGTSSTGTGNVAAGASDLTTSGSSISAIPGS